MNPNITFSERVRELAAREGISQFILLFNNGVEWKARSVGLPKEEVRETIEQAAKAFPLSLQNREGN